MKKLLIAIALLVGASTPAFADAGSGSGSGSAAPAADAGSGSAAPAADAGSGSAVAPSEGSAAPAAAPTPAPETGPGSVAPTVDSPDFLDRIVSLWRSGAGFPAAILILFGIAHVLRAKLAWLTKGHNAAYTAAVVAGIGKLADVAATGATPNQNAIVGAFAGVWLLILQKPAPKSAKPAA